MIHVNVAFAHILPVSSTLTVVRSGAAERPDTRALRPVPTSGELNSLALIEGDSEPQKRIEMLMLKTSVPQNDNQGLLMGTPRSPCCSPVLRSTCLLSTKGQFPNKADGLSLPYNLTKTTHRAREAVATFFWKPELLRARLRGGQCAAEGTPKGLSVEGSILVCPLILQEAAATPLLQEACRRRGLHASREDIYRAPNTGPCTFRAKFRLDLRVTLMQVRLQHPC